MKKVISVAPNNDFTLDLQFDDGTCKRFDVKPYLETGIFTELKDLEYFKDVSIVFGTVQWKNEQDFAPETLYLESSLIEAKELVEA